MIPFKNSYSKLPEHFYVKTKPAQVPSPAFIKVNHELASELGIDPRWLESDEGLAVLAGNEIAHGSEPLAQAYAGHQFGGFSPQLGDGRAVLLGEVIHSDGEPRDIQLKGSGRTHFSRGGDGKAALGPVIREYLMSEAMYALGVPTTRALAAVTTGEKVQRETPLDGAVFTRVASSHLRVGTFQFFAAQQDTKALKILVDYASKRHFPEADGSALSLLENIITAQAKLVTQWMALGFIHGVMNTDNTAISGETIDYGPCAFMDDFHPQCVFSAIDRNGRYAWGNQASIAHWNLTRLAETLIPLIADDKDKALELIKPLLDKFSDQILELYTQRYAQKLGVPAGIPVQYIQDTLTMLADQSVDYTLFFRHLTVHAAGGKAEQLTSLFLNPDICEKWLTDWKPLHNKTLIDSMRTANPIIIPRNHQIERAIQDATAGNFSTFHSLTEAWKAPYDQPSDPTLEYAPLQEERVMQTFCGT